MEDTQEPMELTPEMLAAYLGILRDAGVAEFVGQGFHVRFDPAEPRQAPMSEQKPETKRSASLWENENLWPGGEPPTFFKKDK